MGISLRKYAVHRGLSLKAIQKAIQSGRIKRESDGTIDPVQVDADWARNTRVSATSPRHVAQQDSGANAQDGHPETQGVPDYHKAHAIRVMYEAKLAKLEVGVREGNLVPLEEVNRITFNRARRLRDRLISIPRRLASQVAAESNLETIRAMVHAAVIDALEDLASAETTQPLRVKA